VGTVETTVEFSSSTDTCGNSVSDTSSVTVEDTTDPVRKSGTGKSETRRVARGGCFLSNELTRPTEQQEYRYIRSASRNNFEPDSIYGILGFRVVLAPKVSK